MKKKLQVIVLCCLLVGTLGACKHASRDSKYVGKWVLEAMNVNGKEVSGKELDETLKHQVGKVNQVLVEIKSDGVVDVYMGTKKYSGKWEETKKCVNITADTVVMKGQIKGKKLVADESGSTLTFKKSKI